PKRPCAPRATGPRERREARRFPAAATQYTIRPPYKGPRGLMSAGNTRCPISTRVPAMLGSPPSSIRPRLWYHIRIDVQGRSMTLRYALSELRRPAARRAFGRVWLWVCAAGALASVVVVGWNHAFFIAAVWLVAVVAAARIAVEVLHSRGPRLRRALQLALAGRQHGYAAPE